MLSGVSLGLKRVGRSGRSSEFFRCDLSEMLWTLAAEVSISSTICGMVRRSSRTSEEQQRASRTLDVDALIAERAPNVVLKLETGDGSSPGNLSWTSAVKD